MLVVKLSKGELCGSDHVVCLWGMYESYDYSKIKKLAMLFQGMYSVSINFSKQHSLKLNAFAL